MRDRDGDKKKRRGGRKAAGTSADLFPILIAQTAIYVAD